MATGADTPLLLCYDGSDPAKHAIERAADLLRTRHAVVLTVWQPTAVVHHADRPTLVIHSPGDDDASERAA